jgi:cytochrome c oxidase assembly factor CtaG
MQFRFALLQLLLGIGLVSGAFTGRASIRGFQYLPQTTAYRVLFFVLGVIFFCCGVYSLTHLHP